MHYYDDDMSTWWVTSFYLACMGFKIDENSNGSKVLTTYIANNCACIPQEMSYYQPCK